MPVLTKTNNYVILAVLAQSYDATCNLHKAKLIELFLMVTCHIR